MKTNMGIVDRVSRMVIAVVIAALYVSNVISGVTAIILLVVATAFILTSFVGFCPLYFPFKVSTRKKSVKV